MAIGVDFFCKVKAKNNVLVVKKVSEITKNPEGTPVSTNHPSFYPTTVCVPLLFMFLLEKKKRSGKL